MALNPHKVAVISPGSFVIPSGRSSSVERVIEKVVPLAAGNLDIRVYGRTGEDGPVKAMLGTVPCCRVPGGSAYLPSILRHLRAWRPDSVDVHNRPILASRLKQRMPQARIYLSLHSTTFVQDKHFPRTWGETALNQLDGIILNSRYLHRELKNLFPGLSAKLEVNHLGVSLEDFVPRWTPVGEGLRKARLEEYGWSGRKIILYIGRLIPEKGVHHLLQALPKLLLQEPQALLLVVGGAFYGSLRETDYVRDLKKMAEAYPGQVEFLPFTPYPQVADWYNLADIVVVPSGEDEAFGLVNVEAMAAGIPVVATRAGGIPEIVEDGLSGFLVNPEHMNDELPAYLLKLLGSEELRREMGLNGLDIVRSRFRWQHTAARWIRIMSQEHDQGGWEDREAYL
ncbi:glycosyltransferase family 4 protein [Paenibacillus physcomitrellae]|uniref:Spore coat protein SA n=1 Tax=Paenibacillus physcomitrellae TaxID=1619311 RepID=A0ABQ1G1X0_9BACL|nr:glycosyltransferase family 4 protein [Paenibacillus physcomitrellae]GGA35766.1 spore coat protein SA [Paenibacillus physcomitrellae]